MIMFDDIMCSGNEARLVDCDHGEPGTSDCSHSEDAGVICGNSGKVGMYVLGTQIRAPE